MPAGTAYFMGIILIVLMTGRLVQNKGSLARAAYPLVAHLRWGWHRCERALERGRMSLDDLFERAHDWCYEHLEVEPVRIGVQQREMMAIDSSTIARLRAKAKLGLAGKGYCHRAGRAVRANIVAVATSVVYIKGVRVGLVRRARFGASPEAAVAQIFKDLPRSEQRRLIAVDAGIATKQQFAAATEQEALVGRLRINAKLRAAPSPLKRRGRGRPPRHGRILHPGAARPELAPDQDFTRPSEKGAVRIRRWCNLHFEEYYQTIIDVVRIDDPAYTQPLLIGTLARELTTEQIEQAYKHRWPVETNFFVAQDTAAMEMPRAWTEQAVARRISLALLVGTLLKAIAAQLPPIAIGPWDCKPVASAGRLAHYLDQHVANFAGIALHGVAPRNYGKNPDPMNANHLQQQRAA